MNTVTISMPEALKGFVDEQVKVLGYDDVSEYFGALVREAQEKAADQRLEGGCDAVVGQEQGSRPGSHFGEAR